MKYRLTLLPPEKARAFADMTFPAYTPMLGGRGLAFGAYRGETPAALALFGPRSSRTEAELLSLFVDPPFRHEGLGTALLGHAEQFLAARGMASLYTVWSDAMAGARAFSRVLEKRQWNEPEKRMLTLRGDMSGDFGERVREKYPKYETPACLPRKYDMVPWTEMTQEDRDFINARKGQPNWHEPNADPFREESGLVPTNSLLLRKEGMISGWLTVHRTAPDTLRYTDVFIREDLKRAGAVAIAMVTHAFWLQTKEGTPKLTMAAYLDNEPIIRMFKNRMGEVAKLNWTWGAFKSLEK